MHSTSTPSGWHHFFHGLFEFNSQIVLIAALMCVPALVFNTTWGHIPDAPTNALFTLSAIFFGIIFFIAYRVGVSPEELLRAALWGSFFSLWVEAAIDLSFIIRYPYSSVTEHLTVISSVAKFPEYILIYAGIIYLVTRREWNWEEIFALYIACVLSYYLISTDIIFGQLDLSSTTLRSVALKGTAWILYFSAVKYMRQYVKKDQSAFSLFSIVGILSAALTFLSDIIYYPGDYSSAFNDTLWTVFYFAIIGAFIQWYFKTEQPWVLWLRAKG